MYPPKNYDLRKQGSYPSSYPPAEQHPNDPYNPNNVPMQPPLRSDYPSYKDRYRDPKVLNDPLNYSQSPYLPNPVNNNLPRSRSHSRDPPPYGSPYIDPRVKGIERGNSNDPMYYKEPYQMPPSRPQYQDYERGGDAPFYEYEKKASANFNKIHSNSLGMDYRQNDFNYPPVDNRGYDYRENPVMPLEDRREYPKRAGIDSPLRRSRGPMVAYPQNGFSKLFYNLNHTITMKPFFQRKTRDSEVELFYNIYPGEVSRLANEIREPPMFTFTYKQGFCSKYCLT